MLAKERKSMQTTLSCTNASSFVRVECSHSTNAIPLPISFALSIFKIVRGGKENHTIFGVHGCTVDVRSALFKILKKVAAGRPSWRTTYMDDSLLETMTCKPVQ